MGGFYWRQRVKETKSQRDKESKRRGLPQPLPKGKGFVAALMHRTWGAFLGVKKTKSQKDKETKRQKVKRQRDKETKSQRDKESKGRCAKVQRRLSYAKVKTYANSLHNDLLVAHNIETGGQSAEVRVSGGQDADGASEGVHHANCSFLLVSDGGANGRG